MNRGSTLILRIVVTGLLFASLLFCIFALPAALIGESKGDFDYAPVLIGLYIPMFLFIFALIASMKLLDLIDHNKVFTQTAVEKLQAIKNSSLIISGLFTVGMPYIFYLADRDDAPGLAALGFVLIGASFVVGTAAAVFQQLLQKAVDLKRENDLTV